MRQALQVSVWVEGSQAMVVVVVNTMLMFMVMLMTTKSV